MIADKGNQEDLSHLTKLKVKYPTSDHVESVTYFVLCKITVTNGSIHEGSANKCMAQFLILLLWGIESGILINYLPNEEKDNYHKM